jgi:uncharacterized OsmC-like protein
MPNPAETPCAAAAACADATTRMIADRLGLPLRRLEVEVTGELDVRGALQLDRRVPVGFERLTVTIAVESAPSVPPDLVARLVEAAETSCVVLQMLRHGVPIDVRCGAA